MSPQDTVERVLKEIHLTFSKSPIYNDHPDKMIIDRKHFLNLLDRLNNGIYDLMDQYEQTRQSRQNAERAFKRKGDEIIEQANESADDIYAAAVIYTESAIGRIRDLMDQTNESMNDLFRQFRRDLKEQKDMLKTHESELESQLADLADTKKYLMVIQEMNREHEREKRDLAAEREAGNQYARSMIYTAATQADVKVNEEYFEKSGQSVPGERGLSDAAPAEKPDIQVNRNAAYFKWKAEQDAKKAEDAGQEAGVSVKEKDAVTGHFGELSEDRGKNQAESPENRVIQRDNVAKDMSDVSETDAGTESQNPEFPDEEAIMRAVLEDERKAMSEMEQTERDFGNRKRGGAGGVLKSIFFGND